MTADDKVDNNVSSAIVLESVQIVWLEMIVEEILLIVK